MSWCLNMIFYILSYCLGWSSILMTCTLKSIASFSRTSALKVYSLALISSFSHHCTTQGWPLVDQFDHHALMQCYTRGERERLFGSREREGKLKITFPFYGKGTGIRKLLREGKGNLRLVIPGIPGNPGNHIKSKIKFKIIFMPWQAIRSQSFFNQCKDDICNRFTQL